MKCYHLGFTDSGEPVSWISMMNNHLMATGVSGSGKSFLLKSLAIQSQRLGELIVVLDYTGDWTGAFCQKDSSMPALNCRYLNVRFSGFSFNPLWPQRLSSGYYETPSDVGNRVAGVLQRGLHLHPAQRTHLANLICALCCDWGAPLSLPSLVQYAGQQKNARHYEAPMARIIQLINTVYCGPEPTLLDLSTPGILVLDLNDIREPDLQTVVAELLLDSMWSLRDTGHGTTPVNFILDEAHRLSFREGGAIHRLLREGRKFGYSAWLATQYMTKSEMEDAVGMADLQAIFRPPTEQIHSTAVKLAGGRKDIVCEVEDALMKLNRGQFIFQDNEGHLRRVTVR